VEEGSQSQARSVQRLECNLLPRAESARWSLAILTEDKLGLRGPW